MADLAPCTADPARLERVRWSRYQVVTADDLTAEHDYFRQKLRRHNRFLHGWGAVCGLEVKPAPLPKQPWRAEVAGGYALAPAGDDIFVAESAFLDLAQCGQGAATDPCDPTLLRRPAASGTGTTVYVAIQYAECLARPVQQSSGCGCTPPSCEYSRVRDSFALACLPQLPASHQPVPGPTLCDIVTKKLLPTCPPCPTDSWVVLAKVDLPASPQTQLAASMIDNIGPRRLVFSTGALQQQLIECCCKKAPRESADLALTLDTTGQRELKVVLTVRNNGPSVANDVVVTDTVTGVTDGTARDFNVTPSGAGTWTGQTLTDLKANLQPMQPGATVELEFLVLIRAPENGVVTNTATVTSSTPDPDLSNNTRTKTQRF